MLCIRNPTVANTQLATIASDHLFAGLRGHRSTEHPVASRCSGSEACLFTLGEERVTNRLTRQTMSHLWANLNYEACGNRP